MHFHHGRELGRTRVHSGDDSAQGCMRVHLDHGRVDFHYGSAVGCMRGHCGDVIGQGA